MTTERWPRGVRTVAAFENLSNDYGTGSSRRPQTARCELHGINIVDRLPRHCPLGTANPLDAIARLRAAAWRVLGRKAESPEHSDALALLDNADVCMACTDRNLSHPTVRRLRNRREVAA